jgi:signal transduction histidine kinase
VTRFKLLTTPIFRLILTWSGIFGLSACLMFGVMYLAVTKFMESQVDRELQDEILSLADNDGHIDRDRLVASVQGRVARHNRTGSYYLVENDKEEVLAGNLPAMPVPFGGIYDLPLPQDLPDHQLRGAGVSFANGVNLLIARDTFPQDEIADLMERTFGIGVLLTLVASLGSGVIVGRRILRRIEAIGRASQEIMFGDLARRIPIGGGDKALDGLAVSLNEMLARIQQLMEGVRQVTDNIAHDMRTPLTRLRQHLEQVRMAGHGVEDYQNAVDVALIETDELLDTFGALLRIAQIESRTSGAQLQSVDLSALCTMIAETYGPVAESEGHRLIAAVVPGLSVRGDRQLLIQMLVNLVENALQHNQRPIEVRLLLKADADGKGCLLTVADDGIGIPLGERTNVLRRFYRLDVSRSTQGSGLGLSLVAAIANYHGAALTLEDNEPGLKAFLHFA